MKYKINCFLIISLLVILLSCTTTQERWKKVNKSSQKDIDTFITNEKYSNDETKNDIIRIASQTRDKILWDKLDKSSVKKLKNFIKIAYSNYYVTKAQELLNNKNDERDWALLEKSDRKKVINFISKALSKKYKEKGQKLLSQLKFALFTKFLSGILEKDLLDLRNDAQPLKNFYMAYLNDKENPKIDNLLYYQGDEFKFHEDKKIFKELKEKKYILIHAPVFESTYDFNSSSLIINKNIELSNNYYNNSKGGLYGFDKVEISLNKNTTIKLNPDIAKEVKKYFSSGYASKEDYGLDIENKNSGLFILIKIESVQIVKNIKKKCAIDY